MRFTILIISTFLLWTCSDTQRYTDEPTQSRLIDSVSIGDIGLRKQIDIYEGIQSSYAEWPNTSLADGQTPILIIDYKGDSLYVCTDFEKVIQKVVCTDRDFKTSKGLGVGTSTQEIKRLYQNVTVYSDLENSEYIVLNGIRFHFTTTNTKRIGMYSDEDPENGSTEISDGFIADAIIIDTKPSR